MISAVVSFPSMWGILPEGRAQVVQLVRSLAMTSADA